MAFNKFNYKLVSNQNIMVLNNFNNFITKNQSCATKKKTWFVYSMENACLNVYTKPSLIMEMILNNTLDQQESHL